MLINAVCVYCVSGFSPDCTSEVNKLFSAEGCIDNFSAR